MILFTRQINNMMNQSIKANQKINKLQAKYINRQKQMSNRKVSYFYHDDVGKFFYYKDHPMKPKRMAMTHSLIQTFDLYRKMDVYKSRYATKQQLLKFHHPEYVNYLQNFICKDVLTSEGFMYTNDKLLKTEQQRSYQVNCTKKKAQFSINQTGDCPSFAGLYEFCQLSCGGSIDAANLLMNEQSDICINWSGGLHHAKKCQASGFCYTNDIVLGILEFLKYKSRALYIDVDVHHGDGVQEAFFLTDRVMCVSFHQYGQDFFPGTGALESIGEGKGKFYSLNVPLKPGMDDDTYCDLFRDIMDQVIAKYRPQAVVLQLGADSLANDVLGRFNLTVKGHAYCVRKMISYGLPLLMVGGGGYSVHNVARCWLYQTGLAIGQQVQGIVPKQDRFYEAYLPDNKIHFSVKPVKNKNTADYIQNIKETIFEHLRQLESSPGVPFHHVPTMAFTNQKMEQENDNEIDQKYHHTLVQKRQLQNL